MPPPKEERQSRTSAPLPLLPLLSAFHCPAFPHAQPSLVWAPESPPSAVYVEFTRFRGRLAVWVSSRMGVKPFEGDG
jgi:hypothetical protein